MDLALVVPSYWKTLKKVENLPFKKKKKPDLITKNLSKFGKLLFRVWSQFWRNFKEFVTKTFFF